MRAKKLPAERTAGNYSLLSLAVPILIEQVLRSLMGTVNTSILGHYSTGAVSSVGVANQIMNITTVLFNIATAGAVVLLNQTLGAGERRRAGHIAMNALSSLIGEREAAPDGILKSFDEYVAAISQSAAMNEVRRNKGTPLTKDAGTDFKSGTEYLGPWLVRRTHYLDQTYAMTEGGDAAQAENAEGTESNGQEGEQ